MKPTNNPLRGNTLKLFAANFFRVAARAAQLRGTRFGGRHALIENRVGITGLSGASSTKLAAAHAR